MKKTLKNIYLLIFTGMFCASCSNLQDEITAPVASVAVHEAGFSSSTSSEFHGKYIANINWNLKLCKSCHGNDYKGGVHANSCLTCHKKANGPENCSTCHPDGEDKNFSGIHAKHLAKNGNNEILCSVCHTVPVNFYSPGHIDEMEGAEITFTNKAKLISNIPNSRFYNASLAQVVPQPSYNFLNKSCTNVYCHGNFKNGNKDNVVKWTDNFKCGSCHGDAATGNPMPKGTHTQSQIAKNCYFCHIGVVSETNSNYQIIDKSKHINGKLNYFNDEIVF